MVANTTDEYLVGQNAQLFHQSALTTGNHIQHTLEIAGSVFKLNFSDRELAQKFTRAFSHLEIQSNENFDCELFIWDGASTGIEAVGLPDDKALELIRRTPGKEEPTWNPSLYLNDSESHLLFEEGSGALSMLSVNHGTGIYWVPDKAKVPYWEFGAPFRNIISWWLTSRKMIMVHGGAIGLPQGGILLAGKGGSGKSTTCLRSLKSKLFFAGDDYVCVNSMGQPSVFSIYGSAKVNFDNIHRVPELQSEIINHDQDDEKALLFPSQFAPEKMIASFPLKAILLPTVRDNKETKLIPTSPTKGLTAIAPSTMFQLRGDRRASFDMLVKLVRDVPCYDLELGPISPTLFDEIIGLIQ